MGPSLQVWPWLSPAKYRIHLKSIVGLWESISPNVKQRDVAGNLLMSLEARLGVSMLQEKIPVKKSIMMVQKGLDLMTASIKRCMPFLMLTLIFKEKVEL